MAETHLPLEVELAYEVMPCNALRVSQEPKASQPHSCAYFRQWGTYHSFDYAMDGPPATPGVPTQVKYVGRAPLLPEILSGCRKAPIVGVGINPNLPGWSRAKRGALNPLFDDYRQYAHYFRYRAVDKLIVAGADYTQAGGGPHDTPFSDFELNIPPGAGGARMLDATLDPQSFYRDYQSLLDDLAAKLGWNNAELRVGEDLAYMNMVACPSARWTTQPMPGDPDLPPMTVDQRNGIVTECFRERRYFLRQLMQSLPPVLLVISQNTADAFLREMAGRFSKGNPQPGASVRDLVDQDIRLKFGTLPDGSVVSAKVIFSPHFTGDPATYQTYRPKVLAQLVAAAQEGLLRLAPGAKHLARGRGGCVFCPMLEIGKCDYEKELQPIALAGALLGGEVVPDPLAEKQTQLGLLQEFVAPGVPVATAWQGTDDLSPIT